MTVKGQIVQEPQSDTCSLSSQQARIVRSHENTPPAAIRSVCVFKIDGGLDSERLRASVIRLAEFHEILSARLVQNDPSAPPRVAIEPFPQVEWTEIGWEQLPEPVQSMPHLLVHGKYDDLPDGFGIAATWVKRADPEGGWLVISAPSVLLDSASFVILLRDLCRLYNRPEEPLPSRAPHFRDIMEWQTGLLADPEFEEEHRHWRAEVASLTSLRPADRAASWRSVAVDLQPAPSPGEPARLAQFDAKSAHFLALWLILINLHWPTEGAETAICFDGRNYEGLDQVAGPLSRFLPLRETIVPSETLAAFVQRLGARLDDYENWQEYFDPRLLESGSRSAFVDWMFEFRRDPEPMPVGGALISVIARQSNAEHFGLRLSVVATGAGQLSASLDYEAERFTEAEAANIARQFEALVLQAKRQGGLRVGDMSPLAESMRPQLIVLSRGEDAQAAPPLLQVAIASHAARSPDAIAIEVRGEVISFIELERRSNRWANALIRRGLAAEDRVGVCLDREPAAVVAMLAILKASGAYVPIDPSDPPTRKASILRAGDVRYVLCSAETAQWSDGSAAQWLPIDLLDAEVAQQPPPPVSVHPDQLAYVLFTSGTTGTPKGVMVSHLGLANYLAWSAQAYGLHDVEFAIAHTPLASDLTVTSLWTPLACGKRVILARDRAGVEGLLEAVPSQGGVGVLKLTPTHLRALTQMIDVGELARRCSALVVGGEALFQRDLAPWLAGNPALLAVNEYGPTEAVVGCCIHVAGSTAATADSVPIGGPVAGSEIYVLDRELRLLPHGVVGEIYIGGVPVARGYVGQQALTAERFVPHPFASRGGQRLYRTGDLARRRYDGTLEFLGRTDEQIKVRGFRVEVAEIEGVLTQHAGVKACAVALRDGGGTSQLVAYIVASRTSPPSDREMRDFLRERLPPQMMPAAYVRIEAVPLTPSGKVDRRRLPAVTEAERLHRDRYVAPHSFLEESLVAIWSRVLGIEEVGVEDSYFALGGDSILAIRIVAEARQKGLDLTIDTLFAFPQIRELATRLSQSAAFAERPANTAPFRLVSDEDRKRVPASVVDAYPLSALQAGMLYAMDYFAQSAIYHDVASYHLDLRAPLDLDLLQSAVDALVAQHPALATTFDLTSYSEPLQLVWQGHRLTIDVDDISHLPPAACEARIAAWIEAEKQRPFVNSELPLMRMHIHLRGVSEIEFSLGFHHAILDGWSEATLLTELFDRYFALRRGDQHVWPVRASGLIAEFLSLERAASKSEASREYYRNLLDAAPTLVVPRSARPASTFDAKRGAITVEVPIGETAGLSLMGLANQLALPIKSVLMAIHIRALAHLGGVKDVATTIVSSGRPELAGGTAVLGLFLNSVPVRISADTASWKELVRACFEAERASIPHRRFPFAEVKRMMAGREPPDTLFYFTHYHVFRNPAVREEMDVMGDTYYEETTFGFVANFWLDPFERSIHLNVTCDASRFGADDVARFAASYGKAIEAIAGAPDGCPSDADMLALDQRQLLLADWQGKTAGDLTHGPLLHALVERQVRLSPHAEAVRFRDRLLSYRQLDEAADCIAARLRREGTVPGSIVGVMMCRSEFMIVALLGCLKAKAAYLPLEPDSPPLRLARIVDEAKVTIALVYDEPEAPLSSSCRVIAVRTALNQPAEPWSDGEPEEPLPLDAPAYAIYTSGTTGRPKGVMVSHRAIANRLLWMQEAYGLQRNERVLQKTPFTFDVSLWDIFWPLIQGATVIVAEPGRHADADYLARTIEEWGVTTVHFVPSMLRSFIQSTGPGRCGSLKRLIASGEALDRDLQDRVLECLPQVELHNLYGPTEAAVDVTAWRCLPADRRSVVPIGRPIANLRIYILDPWLHLAPVGTVGDIYIAGSGLALGYVSNPGLTAERFVPDAFATAPGERMYRTGDRGRWSADGQVEFQGRHDGQIKLRGYRIETAEIEACLRQHRSVREAAVLPIELSGARRLVAFVAPEPGAEGDPDALRHFLSPMLPFYMIPSAFEFRPSLPRTASGKLDRGSLILSAHDAAAAGTRSDAFGSPLEDVLCVIWSEVLGVEMVAPNDNFFSLGGDSIAATRIVGLIRDRLDADLQLRRLFEMPTIRQLAHHIEGRRGEAPARIERSQAGATSPLSFAQQRLWFLEELDPHTASFVLPGALLLEGLVDPASLEQALIGVAERHETLRTSFLVESGSPVQRVDPAATISLSVVDMQQFGEAPARAMAIAMANDDAQRPFDLSTPPVRCSLLRIADASHLLLVTLHHIVADGWSLALLAGELEVIYRSILLASAPELPALPIRFRDYAAWERSTRQGTNADADLDFWRRQLRQLARRPGRFDHAPSSRSRTVRFHLDGRTVDGLRTVARRNGCTLFITLLTGFKALQRILTGADDVLTLTDFADRRHFGTQKLIGFFANQVVLRDDLSGDPSLSILLRRVRDNCFDAFAHAHVPFEQIVGLMARDRVSARRWLEAIPKLVLQSSQPAWDLAGLSVQPIDIARGSAKLDLLVNMVEAGDVLEGWWEHRQVDPMDDVAADMMCSLYCRTLAFIAEVGSNADFAELREAVLREARHLQSRTSEDVGATARSLISAAKRGSVHATRSPPEATL